jgi:hypothetical protein
MATVPRTDFPLKLTIKLVANSLRVSFASLCGSCLYHGLPLLLFIAFFSAACHVSDLPFGEAT